MFREHARSKRLNKIKSRTFRRIHNKSEKQEQVKLLERLERENPELAAELKQGLEKKYAEARTQRQRTARVRWAKVMQRFGGKDARQVVSEQAQRETDRVADLRRAVRGKQEQSDSDDELDEQLDLGEGSLVDRAKRLVTNEAAQSEELPKKGLFAMKFMRDGAEQRREEADETAGKLLDDLDRMEAARGAEDSDEDGSSDDEALAAPPAEKSFDPEELARAQKEVDAMS